MISDTLKISEESVFEALDDAVCRTFEEIAFAETYVLDMNDIPADIENQVTAFEENSDCLCVSIDLISPYRGRLVVRACNELISNLIEMVLGPEEIESDDGSRSDFIAEMLNTLAGAFMARVCPGDATFEIGLPEMIEAPPENLVNHRTYSVNSTPLRIYLSDMK